MGLSVLPELEYFLSHVREVFVYALWCVCSLKSISALWLVNNYIDIHKCMEVIILKLLKKYF